MRIEWIDTLSDPRVEDYRDLSDGELRRRRGIFVAEGRHIVNRLLEGGRFAIRSVLVTESALEAIGDRLAAHAGARVFVAAPAALCAIVGYKFHRGCLAVGERGTEPTPAALTDPPGPRVLVALEHVTDPDNIGSIFRNALAFGADAVLLSPRCADPLYRKAIRVSTCASLAVPFARLDDWLGGLRQLRTAGFTLVALTPRPDASDLAALDGDGRLPARIALLLGAEDYGLSAESRACADVEARIAMARGVDSLNVAVAAGIALHRIHRRGSPRCHSAG
jgi:tRNA G18 (ribose-2'-O)-methylase SpoU